MLVCSWRRALTIVALASTVAAPAMAQESARNTGQNSRQNTAESAALEATPTALPPVTRAAGVTPYRINPGDEIEVYVWGDERLQREIRVLPDGTIAMPLVGQVNAQGLLPEQLQDAISKRLATQYRGAVPQVTVSIRNPTGMQFSVVGKVKTPGSFTPGRYVNLLEAISLAGGPIEFAKLDNISIVRKNGQSVTGIRARLDDVLRNGVPNAGADRAIPRIESGDTIIVP